jgi:hypothetical protein
VARSIAGSTGKKSLGDAIDRTRGSEI